MKKIKQIIKEKKIILLKKFTHFLFPNYRLIWPDLDWWNDGEFNTYLEKFGESEGLNTSRKWMVSQLIRLTLDVEGDTAECGVYNGASSWLIAKFNSAQKKFIKHHYMFDSFEGLSNPSDVDGAYWTKGDLSMNEHRVHENLKDFRANCSCFKGWIPSQFDQVSDRSFSFIHIDVDLYNPTRDSIEFFYPRMNIGAILICDDYGFQTCPGATKAIDDFLFDKPEKMLSLDSGGGFFIKSVQTFKAQL